MMCRALTACVLLLSAGLAPAAQDLVYRLPTDNDALFRGDSDAFYMYCDRNFEGEKSQPWQAGTYGLVRNPFRAFDKQVMFSHMHEGIDIKPLHRDAAGEPTDMVRPIAPGRVVYTNNAPGASNYGRYVVVEHSVPEGCIYSLYAHLAAITCEVGQRVGTGNELGRMGHTGAGLNRVRSHVHLEIALLLHSAYDTFSPPANKHGLYNGLNLAGIDPTPVLLSCREGQPLSLTAHFAGLPEHYRVRVSATEVPDILRRHPFLYKGEQVQQLPAAYDVAFTSEGVPIAFYPADEAVTEPKVISCKPLPTLQQNVTVNRVKNSSKDAALTVSGKNYIRQIFHTAADTPAATATPTR